MSHQNHNCILTERGLQLVCGKLAERTGEFGMDDRAIPKVTSRALEGGGKDSCKKHTLFRISR